VEYETARKGEKLKATGSKEIVALTVSRILEHFNFPEPRNFNAVHYIIIFNNTMSTYRKIFFNHATCRDNAAHYTLKAYVFEREYFIFEFCMLIDAYS
jgi:hypothetical protein